MRSFAPGQTRTVYLLRLLKRVPRLLPGLLMFGMLVAERAELLIIHPLRVFSLVLGGAVIPLLARLAS